MRSANLCRRSSLRQVRVAPVTSMPVILEMARAPVAVITVGLDNLLNESASVERIWPRQDDQVRAWQQSDVGRGRFQPDFCGGRVRAPGFDSGVNQGYSVVLRRFRCGNPPD